MEKHLFDWAVVGAGPAGIAAVGKLLDNGIDPKNLLWIDPHFEVGDFGSKWQHVSSNTKVKLFTKFLHESASFEYASAENDFQLNREHPDTTCLLGIAAAPLKWVSDKFQLKVCAVRDYVKKLKLEHRRWYLKLTDKTVMSKNIILAIGAEPASLDFSNIEEISIPTALNPNLLEKSCHKDDTIAVFGSSHSAIIILKTLIEKCSVHKVINFYQYPLKYAVYLDDWILFDDTGLKGKAAEWAKENIDGKLPDKLTRVLSTPANLKATLPSCNKVIYATGFKRRHVEIDGMEGIQYNQHSGIIAPGLFGLGIAFPEAKFDKFGNLEHRVGLWKFMDYLNRVIPVWLKYST